jgi:hypothetical protein
VAIGTATFTTSTDKLTVAISNLIVDPVSPAFLLSGLGFDISPSAGASITTQTGTLRTVAADGSFTDQTGQTLDWTLHTISGEGDLFLDALVPNAQQPNALGTYTGNGIPGNNGHNPFVATATDLFTISILGLTSSTDVTAAIFRYGTTQTTGFIEGDCTSGCDTGTPGTGSPGLGRDVPPVPEPTSLLLLGSGLLGAATAVRNRRKKKA